MNTAWDFFVGRWELDLSFAMTKWNLSTALHLFALNKLGTQKRLCLINKLTFTNF